MICTPYHQVNEMDGVLGTYMGDKTGVHSVLAGDLRERDRLNELGVDGRMISKLIFV